MTPDAAASLAASSMDSRSELSSHSDGSVTVPLIVTGDAANVGRPSASSTAVRTATRLKRRIRDTGSSCEVANRKTYITPHSPVEHVTKPASRDCCRGVSLRESWLILGRAVLFATGVGSSPTRTGRAPYDRGSPIGLTDY